MANDGKIIIDTNLDTSGFEKDVENASKKVANDLGKGTEKAMKQAEASINKVNFSNIGKQLENVSKSIDNTNSKIEMQKKKLSELKKSFENATDGKAKNKMQEQILNTEASIIKLESQLDKLNSKKIKLNIDKNALNGLDGEFRSISASATKELDKIEKKAQETGNSVRKSMGSISIGEGFVKVGSNISSVGSTLTSHVTLPLVGVGIAAAKVGLDFDSAMSRVKAISEATGEDFTKLKNQAIDLGGSTAFSAKETANGMENLASAGFSTTEIMTAMPGMLDLAASSGEGLASSADIAASTLRGFGLEASQAGHVADVLAKNASKTNAAVGDTGQAMKYVAPAAHAAGLGIEEVAAAIGILSDSGIKGEMAGTTLRSVLTRLASPSKEAAADMQTLGFTAFDAQGKMKPLNNIIGDLTKSLKGKTDQQKQDYIATIFGQEAMSGMLTLVDAGSDKLNTLTDSYKNSDGAAKDMAKTMQDNAKSSIEQMTGSLETAAIKVEEAFAPSITELANTIGNLADKFAELSPEQQEFYAKVLMAVAAGGPALKLIGGLTGGVGGLITNVSKLATFLAPAAAAETALGVGATGATVATGGLAATLGGIATVAAPVIIALGVLAALVAEEATAHDQLDDKLTRTTDNMSDWEKAVNTMNGSTFKSKKQLQDLGVEYKDFGKNISDNFKKKVEESTKTLNEFQLFLGKINIDKVIDDSESKEFTSKIESMVNDSIATINAKKSEGQKSLSDLFKLDDNSIDETEQKILDSIGKGFDTQIEEENKLKTDILAIKQKAVDEKRALNEKEIKDVQDKTSRIKQIELEALSGNDEEKSYSKNDFSARAENTSTEDASKLLKDKKAQLDEENIKIKASYDTQLDMLKMHIEEMKKVENSTDSTDAQKAEAVTEEANAQAEIDKFTKLRDEKTKLKSDEWNEYLKILKEKNPEAMALIDQYSGEELTKADKNAQSKLNYLKSMYKGMNEITESGTYNLVNSTTGRMEEVTVSVDKASGNIVAAVSRTETEYGVAVETVGGATDKMAEDVKKLSVEHSKLPDYVKTALDTVSGAHIDAEGKITNSAGKIVGSLDNVSNAEDGTVQGIYTLNDTPIQIETNADGTIKNMDDVIRKIESVPPSKKITFDVVANGFGALSSNLSNIANQVANAGISAKANIDHNYTGTGGGDGGLTTINEHGGFPEITTGEQELYYLGGGTGILDSGSSKNYVDSSIANQVSNGFGKFVSILVNAIGTQNNQLGQIIRNTLDTANSNKENVKLNQKLATDLVTQYNSKGGTFSSLENEITTSDNAKEKASKMKVEDNSNYARVKQEIDDYESQLDELKNKADETTSEGFKKELEAQEKVLRKKKESAQKEMELAKEVAENEINSAKESADQQVKIAEQKKEKLTKLAEAVSDAIKAELEEQKVEAEKSINDELAAMEKSYSRKIAKIEKSTQSKSDSIDRKLKELEEESTDNSRDKERTDSKNNINVLKTKMANTASEADKRSIELQIKDAQKELKEKEDTWNIEDQKAALEQEKALLQERSDNRKKSLEEQYNKEKESKQKELKETDEYYDKLLETDSVNARARYLLLNGNNQELVLLLNSYAPNWQNAGQTLADSLLTGLNSQKESVEDAISEMVGLRDKKSSSSSSDNTYYDADSGTYKGYASGTSSNPIEGFYYTNEQGPEMSTSGDVAYVSKGAAIKNAMQTQDFIQSEISRQVALMRSSVQAEQANMQALIVGSLARSSNNTTVKNETNNNAPLFHAENVYFRNDDDIEQMSYKLGFYAVRNRPS